MRPRASRTWRAVRTTPIPDEAPRDAAGDAPVAGDTDADVTKGGIAARPGFPPELR